LAAPQAKRPPLLLILEKTMSNADNIKIGDTVRRKAGGPNMTVVDVEEDDSGQFTIFCVWLDEKNNENTGQYPARTLLIVG
jgi:uncharacterized protein YodC (DUF2158 family)